MSSKHCACLTVSSDGVHRDNLVIIVCYRFPTGPWLYSAVSVHNKQSKSGPNIM